jgi:hypothetical protein
MALGFASENPQPWTASTIPASAAAIRAELHARGNPLARAAIDFRRWTIRGDGRHRRRQPARSAR